LWGGCSKGTPADSIIKAGSTVIDISDLNTKLKIESCYRDDKQAPAEWLGLYQLIEEALMEEAAKTIGVTISQEMLEEETVRVDKETKAPELLQSVKNVCSDRTLYQKIYLKPRLVNRLLHHKFSEDKEIQAAAYQKALDLLKLAQSGKDFKNMDGYSVKEIDLTSKKESPKEMAQYGLDWTDPEKDLVENVLDHLQPGDVYQNLREDRYGFYIIRLVERRVKFYKYEMVHIKKMEFVPWFLETVKGVKKQIYLKDLIEKILKNVTTGPVVIFLSQ